MCWTNCGRGVTASALVDPAYRSHPPFTQTLGPEVADLAAEAGFAPDANQRLGLDLIFALDPVDPDMSAAFEVGIVCSRQNLKTGLFKMAALGWLYLLDIPLVVWSAHEFATAKEAFLDMSVLVQSSPVFERRLAAIYRGSGAEAIELVGGQRLIFRARTKGGGRGLTAPRVVLDEAFALQPEHMGALLPTLSAVPDPQVVYGSSAGLASSGVLRGVRDRGRAGLGRLAYLEWCDDLPGECGLGQVCDHRLTAPGCRLDDETRWARANPALGHRITVQHVRAEREAMPPAEFARERLGWWDEPDQVGEELLAAWLDCLDLDSEPQGQPVFCLDVSPNSKSAAVLAGMRRADGAGHLEVAAHKPGTSWVAAWATDRQAKHNPAGWVADPTGPAGGLLEKKNLPGPGGKATETYVIKGTDIQITELSGREYAQACEAFTVAVTDRTVWHMGDQRLQAALVGAGRRLSGDGLWTWSRRTSEVDICPLVAATGALWGLGKLAPGVFFGAYR